MPINELERHPFIDYLDNEIESKREYSGMIIGSFPVYSCTDSLNHNLQIIPKDKKDEITMKFFYGSRRSQFWEYCSGAFGEQNPTTMPLKNDTPKDMHHIARRKTIDFLNRNNLLITDVIRQTNRKEYGDEDSNLWKVEGASQFIIDNLSMNHRLTNIMEQYSSIKNLYFTATGFTGKSPFGWFREIIGKNLKIEEPRCIDRRIWGLICNINGRKFRTFLLPTPKPRGIHFTDSQKTLMFENYLKSVAQDFYNEISTTPEYLRSGEQKQELKTKRHDFLIQAYNQAFVKNNLDFNGTILNPT